MEIPLLSGINAMFAIGKTALIVTSVAGFISSQFLYAIPAVVHTVSGDIFVIFCCTGM